jgi:hypothetical protein
MQGLAFFETRFMELGPISARYAKVGAPTENRPPDPYFPPSVYKAVEALFASDCCNFRSNFPASATPASRPHTAKSSSANFLDQGSGAFRLARPYADRRLILIRSADSHTAPTSLEAGG